MVICIRLNEEEKKLFEEIKSQRIEKKNAQLIKNILFGKRDVYSQTDAQKLTKPKAPKTDNPLNTQIWAEYLAAFQFRYKVNPVRNVKVNSIVKQLGGRLGSEAVDVVRFYLTHNDSFYLKAQHSLNLCLRDAESLHTQMVRGKPVTQTDIRNFEKMDQYNSILTSLKEKGI